MRLYYSPFSFNARRAVMTALHLKAKVDLVSVDLAKGEQRKPDFLRMNPNGKVPVLDDGDFVLWESHAIMQFLADANDGAAIYPREPRARADVNRWLFWSAHHFAPSVSILNWERVVKGFIGGGDPDPAMIKRGEMLVTDLARLLDNHLKERTWLAQGKLTLADLAVASPLMAMKAASLPVTGSPNLMAWFARIQELPAWKESGV